jgi:hypothetical protein
MLNCAGKSRLIKVTRRNNGNLIAELAVSLSILLPLYVSILYVAFEVNQACAIYNGLSASSQQAARNLAIAYNSNSVTALTTIGQNAAFDQVRFANIVNSSSQFSIPTGTSGWNLTAQPATVTVQCTYQSGQHGLGVFPYPDPLNLGSSFILTAQSTCRLN